MIRSRDIVTTYLGALLGLWFASQLSSTVSGPAAGFVIILLSSVIFLLQKYAQCAGPRSGAGILIVLWVIIVSSATVLLLAPKTEMVAMILSVQFWVPLATAFAIIGGLEANEKLDVFH